MARPASTGSRLEPSPMRSFDPLRLGRLECATWVAYYQRAWWRFLRSAVGMVREGFGMSWPRTIYGALLVLRANQLWAPYPDNDADGARRNMRRFYALVARTHDEPFDVNEASVLEVEWWRVHRYLQREAPAEGEGTPDVSPLVDALTALYAHVYRADPEDLRPAAQHRAEAMVLSDRWVAQGKDGSSPLVAQERAALIRSYAALLAAVHHAPAA